MNHTPKPWRASIVNTDLEHDCVVLARPGWVAEVHGRNEINGPYISREERVANAHLISAAPDLLEALKIAVDHASWKGISIARAAIAKAEGKEVTRE